MEKNAPTNSWLEVEYVWRFSGFQIFVLGLSLVLFVLTFFDWLHIFPQKNALTDLSPIDLNQFHTGQAILGWSSLYCFLIIAFVAIKPLNNFLLPLLIAGILLFYYAINEFIIQLKTPVIHDIIKEWVDYNLLVPLYFFVIIYGTLLLFSALILLNKKH